MGLFRGTLGCAAVAAVAMTGLGLHAAPLTVLSAHDVALYQSAFDAAQRGDTAGAEQALAQVSDTCLSGRVQYLELTHSRAHQPSYVELANWLKLNADAPGAAEIYGLALKVKPSDVTDLPTPAATLAGAPDGAAHMAPARENHAAREAYFDGDVPRALSIARATGDAWIAGLASWRLGQFADAMLSFERLAANPAEDDATRAAGGVWAARAAAAAGLPDRVAPLLKIAAAAPDTFYGMIAQRKLELADDPLGGMIDDAIAGKPLQPTPVSLGASESPLDHLMHTDARAHRAAALEQLARPTDASAELRAGFAAAPDDATKSLWMGLMLDLNGQAPPGEIVLHTAAPHGPAHAYPIPNLTPAGGFTIDKALVYAVTWQESRFNSVAVSPVGAVGLMQLMPSSAAAMAGDPSLKADPIRIFDPAQNLALGQTYLTWLEQNAGGYDLLRMIAAYNGGPATLARAEAMVGPDADTLTVIESVPFAETRAYVKKVAAAYWSYRRQFGAPARTLDAAASDQQRVDIRLDQAPPTSAPVQNAQSQSAPAREALEILLHHNG